MKRILILILLILLIVQPVNALDFTAPAAPESARQLMPAKQSSFWSDLMYVIKTAMGDVQPLVFDVLEVCVGILATVLISSIIQNFSGVAKQTAQLVTIVLIGVQLLCSTHSMIDLAKDTIYELTQYGKLLLPVLSGALAAQGAAATSAALYTGTAMFSTLLSTMISKLLVPIVYIFLCLCIANSAIGDTTLARFRDFLKWLITWCLKLLLYIFMGYMSVTGVISGSVDASAIKAAKLTLSGVVPVVGSILSDASETILVSAGIMKNTAGVYGLVALSAILIRPFIKIGIHYMLLKITGAICGTIGTKETLQIIDDFSSGMGFMLAMTGIACLLLMISIVCIMKGVS